MIKRLLVALLAISLVAQSVTVPVIAAEPEVTFEEIVDESEITTVMDISETEEVTEDESSILEETVEESTEAEENSVMETLSETEEMSETEAAFEMLNNVADVSVSASVEPIWESGEVKLFQEGEFDVTYEQVVDGNKISAMGMQTKSTLYEEWEEAYAYIYEQLKANAATINLYSYNIPTDIIFAIYSGVINENPDLFYVTGGLRWNYMSGNGGGPDIVYSITPTYITGLDEDLFYAGVEEALNCIQPGMSDIEKAIAFHDYLVINTKYDYANLNAGTLPSTVYSAYGILALRTGVCQGYALAYKLLCNKVGIECHMVTSDGMNHAWNLIKLDGEYYQVDITWDDPVWDLLGRCQHYNMFVSDSAFQSSREHYGWVVTSYGEDVDLQATSTKYDNYFWTDVNSAMIYDNHDYYYIDAPARALEKIDMTDFSTQTLCSTGTWYVWNGGGYYYTTAYSGLFENGGRLYFNKSDGIYSINPSNTSDLVKEFENPKRDEGYIYGCALLQGEVKYVISQIPNFTADLEVYTAELTNDIVTVVSRVFLSDDEIALSIGDKYTLTYSCSPSSATPSSITWSSSDSTVATVNGGVVTALKKGTCNITLTVDGKSDTCKVTVEGTKYNVRFWEGDVCLDTQEVAQGGSATPPSVTPSVGYRFAGWSGSYENIQADTDLYAVYEPIEYTITYVVGEGTNATVNKTSYTIETDTFVLLDATAPNGYEFVGWYKDSNYQTAISQVEKGSYGNLTLYAKYEPVIYTITYVLGEGSNHSDNISEYTIETENFTLLNPTGAYGDQFVGWYVDEEYTDEITEIKKGSTGNLTIYARWKLAVPTFSHTNSVVDAGEEISIITDRTNAAIYYTVDGSNPTKVSTLYNGPIVVDDKVTIKAIAVLDGYVNSDVAQMTYEPVSVDFALDQQEISLQRKKTMQLGISKLPSGATEDDIIWKSANESVATVEDGLVTAVSVGETTITASVQDYKGRTITAECSVEVLPAVFTVVFRDADGSVLKEEIVEEGKDATPPKIKEYVGYVFAGWSGSYENIQTDTDLYTVYEPIEYTITYVVGDGINSPENRTSYTIETSTFEFTDATATKGYRFVGWYKDSNYQTAISQVKKGSYGNLTLYAKYEPIVYSITYELGEGSNHPGNISEYTIETNSFTLLDPTGAHGDSFAGWYIDQECSEPITEIKKGSMGDLTIYARWKLAAPTFSHTNSNVDLGEKISILTDRTDADVFYTVDGSEPTKDDVLYSGPIVIYDSVTIKAIAVLDGYVSSDVVQMSYVPLSLDFALEQQEISLQRKETMQLGVSKLPSGTTLEDVSWKSANESVATVENGLVTAVSVGETTITASVQDYKGRTITAECSVKVLPAVYTVVFKDADGSILKEEEVEEGKDATPPEVTAPRGYDFIGWDGDYTNVTDDLDLTAQYEVITYYIRYFGGNEVLYSNNVTEYTVESDIIVLENPILADGYEFVGWYDNEEGNGSPVLSIEAGSIGDIELYAKTVRSSYSIKYVLNGGSSAGTNPSTYTVEDTIRLVAAEGNPGFEFAGWYEEEDFSGNPVSVIESGRTGDIILYAKWRDERGLWMNDIEPQAYTGKKITLEDVKVYNGSEELSPGTDYTISYKNNVNANDLTGEDLSKAPAIVIKGKGNYTGSLEKKFVITQKSIEEADVVIDDISLIYKENKVQKPLPVVTWNGKKLKKNKDYVITYVDDTTEGAFSDAGEYTIRVEGCGNYKGTRDITLTIAESEKVLMSKVKVEKIGNVPYTGEPVDVDNTLVVKYKNDPLTLDVDYELEYEPCIEVGTHTIKIHGIGNFEGMVRTTFKIMGVPMNKVKVTGVPKTVYYTGQAITMDDAQWKEEVVLSVTQKIDGENTTITLDPDEDEDGDKDTGNYDVTYMNNTNKGKAQIVFTGKNGYTGTLKKTFNIVAYDMNADVEGIMSAEITDDNVYYAKGGATPKLTVMADNVLLTEGKDYTVSYKNNKSVNLFSDNRADATAIVTGKGNYTGKMEVAFEIERTDISTVKIFADDVEENTAAGKYKSKPVLTDKNGKKLVAGTDYEKTIEYRDDRGVLLGDKDKLSSGVITVTVFGKGNYEGEISTTYRIVGKKMSISKASVSIVKGKEWYYTGDKITINKEDLVVKIGKNQLTPDDFEITGYSNNEEKGTAKVTIKGKGKYGGNKTVSFKIKGQPMKWWTPIRVLEFIWG